MSKHIILTAVCILALLFCYGMEQKVYKSRSFSYYQQKEREKAIKYTKEAMTESYLSKGAVEENQIYMKNQEQKIAYLTFDDGPSMVTKQVLDILRENEVHATFFLIGSQINDNTVDIVRQLAEDGHTIGVHTYSHKGAEIYKSKEAYIEDFKKASASIEEVIGYQPKIFRFPWGSVNKYLGSKAEGIILELEAEGYTYFDWNVSAEDSVGTPTAESILRNINKDYARYQEPIILMHDSSINEVSAKILPEIIKNIKTSGYRFDTLDHMEKPYQYARD